LRLVIALLVAAAPYYDNDNGGRVTVYTQNYCHKLRTLDIAAAQRDHFRIWRVTPSPYVAIVSLHVARTVAPCLTAQERNQSKVWLQRRGLTGVRFRVRIPETTL
jgi:hypothetical protein